MPIETTSYVTAEYVSHMGDDLTPVNSAKVSYGRRAEKTDAGTRKLTKFLLDNGHMTPFEHNVLTVRISCPIYIARQIFRHRTFSFNEKSRRYTKSNRVYYISHKLALSAPFLESLYVEADATYEALLEKDFAKEDARAVLPQALMTEFYMTGNLRNWMHFLELRLTKHAQEEARTISKTIGELLGALFPEIMNIWCDEDWKTYFSP